MKEAIKGVVDTEVARDTKLLKTDRAKAVTLIENTLIRQQESARGRSRTKENEVFRKINEYVETKTLDSRDLWKDVGGRFAKLEDAKKQQELSAEVSSNINGKKDDSKDSNKAPSHSIANGS